MPFEYIRTAEGHFQCPYCDYTKKLQSSVHMHISAKHTGVFKHKCEHCNYETNTLQRLNAHLETKHQDELNKQANKPFTCHFNDCDYECRTKAQLRSHTLLRHMPAWVNKYLGTTTDSTIMCTHCGLTHGSKPAFLYHLPNCLPNDVKKIKPIQHGLCL